MIINENDYRKVLGAYLNLELPILKLHQSVLSQSFLLALLKEIYQKVNKKNCWDNQCDYGQGVCGRTEIRGK